MHHEIIALLFSLEYNTPPSSSYIGDVQYRCLLPLAEQLHFLHALDDLLGQSHLSLPEVATCPQDKAGHGEDHYSQLIMYLNFGSTQARLNGFEYLDLLMWKFSIFGFGMGDTAS